MALSGFDFISSFLGGVQERAQEYDDALAKRIQELADKGPSDTTKSKYKADYDEYLADKKTLSAIQAAGITSDRGQMLAGGYKSMEDYFAAREKDPNLYHEMFTLGDEPKYTPADYGITNVRDDGSTVTTAGQMFDQFFRPEVHKARSAELIPTPTPETSTTYRRGKNVRTAEDIETSKEAIRTRVDALQSVEAHKDMPDKIDHYTDDGMIQSFVKISDVDSDESKDAEKIIGVFGYMSEGEKRYVDNSKFAQGIRELGPKPDRDEWLDVRFKESEDTPMSGVIFDADKEFAKVLADWTYRYNSLIYGEAIANKIERGDKPDIGTIISGIYNEDGKKVSIEYTENPEHIFMEGTEFEKKGWIQVGGVETVTPTIGSTLDVYDSETDTVQQVQYVGGTASFEGMEGYEKVGDAKPVKDSKNLQTSYNDKGEEVKILYTGNAKHSFEGREGWQQIGKAKATTASELSASDLQWQPMQIIVEAIKSGGVVSEQQLEAAAFIRAQGDTAMELEFSAVLQDWDRITVMVRDLSYKMLVVVKLVDGKLVDTGGRVKGTQENVREQARNSGMSEREYREQLLGLN